MTTQKKTNAPSPNSQTVGAALDAYVANVKEEGALQSKIILALWNAPADYDRKFCMAWLQPKPTETQAAWRHGRLVELSVRYAEADQILADMRDKENKSEADRNAMADARRITTNVDAMFRRSVFGLFALKDLQADNVSLVKGALNFSTKAEGVWNMTGRRLTSEGQKRHNKALGKTPATRNRSGAASAATPQARTNAIKTLATSIAILTRDTNGKVKPLDNVVEDDEYQALESLFVTLLRVFAGDDTGAIDIKAAQALYDRHEKAAKDAAVKISPTAPVAKKAA